MPPEVSLGPVFGNSTRITTISFLGVCGGGSFLGVALAVAVAVEVGDRVEIRRELAVLAGVV